MFNIRKISNALLVSHQSKDGTSVEEAFLLSDAKVKDHIRTYISKKKLDYADYVEKHALDNLDRILASDSTTS